MIILGINSKNVIGSDSEYEYLKIPKDKTPIKYEDTSSENVTDSQMRLFTSKKYYFSKVIYIENLLGKRVKLGNQDMTKTIIFQVK